MGELGVELETDMVWKSGDLQEKKQLIFYDANDEIEEVGRLWINERGNLEFAGDLERAIGVVFGYLRGY